MSNPPVQLSKIMIGDPGLGSNKEFKIMPTVRSALRDSSDN